MLRDRCWHCFFRQRPRTIAYAWAGSAIVRDHRWHCFLTQRSRTIAYALLLPLSAYRWTRASCTSVISCWTVAGGASSGSAAGPSSVHMLLPWSAVAQTT